MIGIICEENQSPFVVEFFELFKVPWEFYVHERFCEVVIVAGDTDTVPDSRLSIILGAERKSWDACQVMQMNSERKAVLLNHKGYKFQ